MNATTTFLTFVETDVIKKLNVRELSSKDKILFDQSSKTFLLQTSTSIHLITEDFKVTTLSLPLNFPKSKISFFSFSNQFNSLLCIVNQKEVWYFNLLKLAHTLLELPKSKNLGNEKEIKGVYLINYIDLNCKILYIGSKCLIISDFSRGNPNQYFLKHKVFVNNFFFISDSELLIVQSGGGKFYLYNLKGIICNISDVSSILFKETFNETSTFKVEGILNISKFYFERIYNNYYLIHLTENLINVFQIKENFQAKIFKTLTFNFSSFKGLKYDNILLLFENNIIILFSPYKIILYDIMQKENPKVGEFSLEFEPKTTLAGYENIIKVNKNIFKVNLNNEYFYLNSTLGLTDTFTYLLNRKNALPEMKNILSILIISFSMSSLETIFSIIVKRWVKVSSITREGDGERKEQRNELRIKKKCVCEITQEQLYQVFLGSMDKISDKEKLLKILLMLCGMIQFHCIAFTEGFFDVFHEIIFDIENFSMIDAIVKGKLIPIEEQTANILIKRFVECKSQKRYVLFNLAMDIFIQIKRYDKIVYMLSNCEYKQDIVAFLHDNINEIREVMLGKHLNLKELFAEILKHVNG